LACTFAGAFSALALAQTDPGVRPGAAGAGGPLAGVTAQQAAIFNNASGTFQEVDSVTGTIAGESGQGLGPGFNMNSCAGCHKFPAVGGTSPPVNPQVAIATLHGAHNVVPAFITANGPVREVRFRRNPDGSPDGGVHDLFVITGRSDAPSGCTATQTNFAAQVAANNVSFRIPTPTFGLGLIEAIEDAAILANKADNAFTKALFGISGHENRTGNDGTITRFGWKAQNKSLAIFAGEAYNVEQGVTNELFPNPRETAPGCDAMGHPEDSSLQSGSPFGADVTQFALFIQLLAPPKSVTSYDGVTSSSIQRGHDLFTDVGCALCHTETLVTGPAVIPALANQTIHPFSDVLVHNMGPGLADSVSQGNARGDEFRSAPLWGLGQRIFLLHDGRTRDLPTAIQAHSSEGNGQFPDSEANTSVFFFNLLPASSKQDVLNFLRSL
jgi:CxxC motif-containing protein (DUF1111 family)